MGDIDKVRFGDIQYEVQVEFYLGRDRGEDEMFSGAHCDTWEEVEELFHLQDVKQLLIRKLVNDELDYVITVNL